LLGRKLASVEPSGAVFRPGGRVCSAAFVEFGEQIAIDASLEAVRGILENDLRSEVEGSERRFFETHYDAMGQHGEVRECPVVTSDASQPSAAKASEKFFRFLQIGQGCS